MSEKVPIKDLPGGFHYGFNRLGKDLLPGFLIEHAREQDLERWIEFLSLLRKKLWTPQAEATPA
jgi:hypothetical protein